MRILTITNLFPNHIQQNRRVFIRYRLEAFVKLSGAHLDVIAPLPYFPQFPIRTPWSDFGRIRASETQGPFQVYHPRYIVIPKTAMRTQGQSLYWSLSALVRRLHREHRYDVVDAHWVYPDGYAAVKIANILRIPSVVSARGFDVTIYSKMRAIRKLIQWTFEHSSHVIAVSNSLKSEILNCGVASDHVTVVGNGVDTDVFSPMSKQEARDRLGIRAPVGGKIVLSVGSLDANKGHQILIQAIAVLKGSFPELRMYIIGSGPLEKELKSLIESLGLSDRVKLCGQIPNHALREWYSASDVFCLASEREGWPNVLLESIACGTPVIGTNVDGIPEIISSQDIGVVVQERTPEGFSNAISVALDRNWCVETLSRFAHQHRWEKVAASLQDVFQKAIATSFV
jgi:teichuronic acid biosynthesis glycosyltransferase TuaC